MIAQKDTLLGLPLEVGDTGVIFKVVEQMPIFPGCHVQESPELANYADAKRCADKLMVEFVYGDVLEYPEEAAANGVEGMAVISFIIERDGRITSARILRDPGAGTGEEALRIVDIMAWELEPWRPGFQGDVPVRVQFNLPVKFRLD